jgi:3-hydroxyisobutyrate dehydrogenase
MNKLQLAFIGLGTMGYPMAGHLARAGHSLSVYNRTASKAIAWHREHGGRLASTPADAARGAAMIFTCVGGDEDLKAVLSGAAGAMESAQRDAVFVDHSTTSAGIARAMADAAASRGARFLDAPVSGGEAGAKKGSLTVMVGGDAAVFERARPVMEAYARAVTLMGAIGSGQLTKMVNQICVVGLMQGLAEGIAFGQKAGLDMNRVLDALTQGAAASWQMANRGKTMVEGKFDFGFAIDWMHKDLRICLAEAAHNGAALPHTALIEQHYAELQGAGMGREDFSALIERLRD